MELTAADIHPFDSLEDYSDARMGMGYRGNERPQGAPVRPYDPERIASEYEMIARIRERRARLRAAR